jgi:signal transduction histidine kinase
MKGASDLILKDAHNLNKKQIEILLTQIRTSSSDMLKLVNNVLDVAKIDSGRFTISKTFGNINKTLRDESDYHTTLAGIKNIQINVQLDEAIPSFNFDAQRIGLVVNNMLANAIKAMRDGGTINLSSKKHQKRVEIVVTDLGDGLEESIKDKIFDLDSRDKIKGLGLVVAKSVVKAHGGEIRVESNKPKGSKFIFTLPLS